MNKNILRTMRENVLLRKLKVVSEGKASENVVDVIVGSSLWFV